MLPHSGYHEHRVLTATALVVLVASIVSCGESLESSDARDAETLITVPVRRQNIITNVTSNGKIEPIREIEIKSKASGKILRLPVETGQVVEAGALLVQVDTTEAATQVRQTRADLDYQRTQLTIAESRARRSVDMLAQGMISQDEYDQAQLHHAQIRASFIRTEADLEGAEERRRETVVRAPMRGTVLEKKVELGQIISSATRGVSEGTTLLKMADLTNMQVRILMDQTDLSKIKPGQIATITADAFRARKFAGTVIKIEPQFKRERDVTYYPVLVKIDNREGLLLPGMDCTANIHVSRLDSVLAISTDAVVALSEAEKIAPLLDVPQDIIAAAIVAAGGTPTGVTEIASQRNQIPWWIMRGAARPAQSGGPMNTAIVFVVDSAQAGIRPVPITFGVQDWDVTQVVEGLSEGTTVVIPPSAMIAQQFKDFREQMARFGASLPGKTK